MSKADLKSTTTQRSGPHGGLAESEAGGSFVGDDYRDGSAAGGHGARGGGASSYGGGPGQTRRQQTPSVGSGRGRRVWGATASSRGTNTEYHSDTENWNDAGRTGAAPSAAPAPALVPPPAVPPAVEEAHREGEGDADADAGAGVRGEHSPALQREDTPVQSGTQRSWSARVASDAAPPPTPGWPPTSHAPIAPGPPPSRVDQRSVQGRAPTPAPSHSGRDRAWDSESAVGGGDVGEASRFLEQQPQAWRAAPPVSGVPDDFTQEAEVASECAQFVETSAVVSFARKVATDVRADGESVCGNAVRYLTQLVRPAATECVRAAHAVARCREFEREERARSLAKARELAQDRAEERHLAREYWNVVNEAVEAATALRNPLDPAARPRGAQNHEAVYRAAAEAVLTWGHGDIERIRNAAIIEASRAGLAAAANKYVEDAVRQSQAAIEREIADHTESTRAAVAAEREARRRMPRMTMALERSAWAMLSPDLRAKSEKAHEDILKHEARIRARGFADALSIVCCADKAVRGAFAGLVAESQAVSSITSGRAARRGTARQDMLAQAAFSGTLDFLVRALMSQRFAPVHASEPGFSAPRESLDDFIHRPDGDGGDGDGGGDFGVWGTLNPSAARPSFGDSRVRRWQGYGDVGAGAGVDARDAEGGVAPADRWAVVSHGYLGSGAAARRRGPLCGFV